MPRQAIEITVGEPERPLRIINTHLEFHSQRQRRAQLNRLRELQSDVAATIECPPAFDEVGPYQRIARPLECVLCGDFNMGTDFDEYSILTKSEADRNPMFLDAWSIARDQKAHDPTCGIFDHNQWPQGPHCRDFFFVTDALASDVRNVVVNTETDASDHQPLVLELNEN